MDSATARRMTVGWNFAQLTDCAQLTDWGAPRSMTVCSPLAQPVHNADS